MCERSDAIFCNRGHFMQSSDWHQFQDIDSMEIKSKQRTNWWFQWGHKSTRKWRSHGKLSPRESVVCPCVQLRIYNFFLWEVRSSQLTLLNNRCNVTLFDCCCCCYSELVAWKVFLQFRPHQCFQTNFIQTMTQFFKLYWANSFGSRLESLEPYL